MSTLTYTDTLTVIECGVCHIPFAVPELMYQKLHRNHDWFWCPNGDKIHYFGKTEAEKLADQLATTEQRLEASRSLARREAERRQHAERQRAAARGQVTKIKRRVGRGVCPCCNRTFADLQRHMSGQHPEYADEVQA